jgi:hypothetical protein
MPRAGPTDRAAGASPGTCSETDFSERDRPGFALLCQSQTATSPREIQASGGGNRSSRPYTKAERRDNAINPALTHCGKPPQSAQPSLRKCRSRLPQAAVAAHI